MADQYGLNDLSMLSGPAQLTARQVQQAFDNSNMARLRMRARYSLPELANLNQDSALARAQTAAGLINQNQQLQNVIDESHSTPHGVAENISAYLPLLGIAPQLASMLFGRAGGGALAEQGLFGLGKQAWNAITHPGSGQSITVDANGNIVSPAFDPNSPWADATYPNMGGPAVALPPPTDNYGWAPGFGESAVEGFDPGWAAGFGEGAVDPSDIANFFG